MQVLREALAHGGPRALWTGFGPTILRDIPFSAIYWAGYEFLKSTLQEKVRDIPLSFVGPSPPLPLPLQILDGCSHTQAHVGDGQMEGHTPWIPFLAGASSGIVAAFLTLPVDVIKTRSQSQLQLSTKVLLTHPPSHKHKRTHARAHTRARTHARAHTRTDRGRERLSLARAHTHAHTHARTRTHI